MGKVRDDDLHRLHDGELDPEERRTIEASLDDEDRAKLAALAELSAVVRGASSAESGPPIDVWSTVEAGIRAQATPISWGAKARRVVREYRSVWMGTLAAAAAVVALYIGRGVPGITNHCDIESLEVSGASATVLHVPSSEHGDDTTTVVWLDEEELKSRLHLLAPLALSWIALAPPARADEPAPAARCTLRVVDAQPHATGGAERTIDPQLEPLKDRLSRPPFLSWKTFHLLSQEEREIMPTGKVDYALPDGRQAELVYAEHARSAEGRHLVRGSLRLIGPKSHSRTMFALDEGGTFLVAGAKHGEGILIYALSCRTEK